MNVAAYCRVSTDEEDQKNSFESQKLYFENYINNNPEWSLVNIYADEGITGTNTKKRVQFQKMINDASKGIIDLILTKEVSRFARNTVDTLSYTRQLKSWNVGVIFLSDNINTLDNDGELRLTIMASMAQEESRKTSERVKWGIKRKMENGFVFAPDLLGYDVRNGKISINEEEAVTVRKIFDMFTNQKKSAHAIAKEFTEQGIEPVKRMKSWSSTTIYRILKNEKYVGDLLQKKKITEDFLSHKLVDNDGQEEKIFIANHHDPIIDRELWEETQRIITLNKLTNQRDKVSNVYWCSGKIICGLCGKHFSIRAKKLKSGRIVRSWKCIERMHFGVKKINGLGKEIGCDNPYINQIALENCIKFALSKILTINQEDILKDLKSYIDSLSRNDDSEDAEIDLLNKKIKESEKKKLKIIKMYIDEQIEESEMMKLKEQYDVEIDKMKKRILLLMQQKKSSTQTYNSIDNIFNKVKDIVENEKYYNENFYNKIVDKMVAFPGIIDIYFRNFPIPIKVKYQTKGRGKSYQTLCELV